ncbi:MAG TPA: alpha/beta hydrolase [Aggregatilineales bacterium]|nr:alpha/beta hydrolase [Aggregatilineales bacterium]
MLHGWPYDHTHMAFEMERHFTLRAGWRRIYVDLPGMGRTPGADWILSSDDMLNVLEQFIDRLVPNQRFLVAGLSYGGYLARGLIYRRGAEIDGVLLSVPSTGYPAEDLPPRSRVVRDSKVMTQAHIENMAWIEDEVVSENASVLDYVRIINAMPPGDEAFLKRLRKNRVFSFDVDAPARPFEAPSLFILGRQDHLVGYRRQWQILENYPRATFAVLDGGGHLVWGEKTTLCQALVSDWLDRVEEWVGSNSPDLHTS